MVVLDYGITAYVTIDGVVHAVVWRSAGTYNEQLTLLCSRKHALAGTRTAANIEIITCLQCLGAQ